MLNSLYNEGKQFVTSVITFEEYAMVPIRESNMNLITEFEHFLDDTETIVIDITKEIVLKEARFRSEYKHLINNLNSMVE